MSSTPARDEFFTVKEINSMAQSHVGSKITKPVFFKVLSDRDLKVHNILLVGDSESDQMEIEFEPSILQDMIKKSKFLFPGTLVKAFMLEFRRRGVVFVSRNTHLAILTNSKEIPARIAEPLVSLQCETARKDLTLKHLSETTSTNGVSEEIWMKIVGKFESHKTKAKSCMILKVADHTARMVFKIWRATHPALVNSLKVGDFCKFRNLIVKHQVRKDSGLAEIFLQFVSSHTLLEKMSEADIKLLPPIPMEHNLGDAIFQGDVVELSRFEWNDLCHLCENWTSVHNCDQHPHGPETNLKSYSFQMVGFDQTGSKKEFLVRKSEVEDFRDKSITLQEEDDANEPGDGNKALTEAFHKLMNQPLQVIYNINAKTQDLYATHVTIIGTTTTTTTAATAATAGESKKKEKKRKTVAAAVDEASAANKKTKNE